VGPEEWSRPLRIPEVLEMTEQMSSDASIGPVVGNRIKSVIRDHDKIPSMAESGGPAFQPSVLGGTVEGRLVLFVITTLAVLLILLASIGGSLTFGLAGVLAMGFVAVLAIFYLTLRPEEGGSRTLFGASMMLLLPFAIWLPFSFLVSLKTLWVPVLLGVVTSSIPAVEGFIERAEEAKDAQPD